MLGSADNDYLNNILMQQAQDIRNNEKTIRLLDRILERGKYTAPENTYKVSEYIDIIKDFNQNIGKAIKGIGAVLDYIFHPIKIWIAFEGASYYICLFVGLTGLILYIFGYKKGGRAATVSLGAYTLIQVIDTILR